MMSRQNEDNVRVKIETDNYGTVLLITRNGYQWSGMNVSPVMARLTIEILQQYLIDEKIENL